MDPSRVNSQDLQVEYQRQAIDAEIESLEESIRALRQRRNALAPVSSPPTEVIAAIFSCLHVPVAPPLLPLGERPDHLALLQIAHVCHHWRDIALNQPLYWNHVNFTVLSLAGATDILARAKAVPLYLEARVSPGRWNDGRFSAFRKELQARTSHICHLGISAEPLHLRKTLEALASPAYTLEHLSLSSEGNRHRAISSQLVSVPDTLFDGTTPRLSYLELRNCAIDWKSLLFKGLRHLDIRTPSEDARPSLLVWLDALDKMPQLKTLTLHSASPIARGASPASNVERTITLPSLAHLSVSASASDCGLALAHLVLPALTQLCLTAGSCRADGSDVHEMLPYFSRHAHGLQHAQPIRCVVDRSHSISIDILVWQFSDPIAFDDAELSVTVPVEFSLRKDDDCQWSNWTPTEVYDAAMAALPLDNLVTLSSQESLSILNKQSWLNNAPRWPLLQGVHLGPSAARGFEEMLLEDNVGRESPLLPSLVIIVLIEYALNARRTLRLCDALMKRVEQGVPLETLDLHTCSATSRAIQLLSEIVVEVLGPDGTPRTMDHRVFTWDSAFGLFSQGDSSRIEGYEDNPDTGSYDEVSDNWDTDGDEDEAD